MWWHQCLCKWYLYFKCSLIRNFTKLKHTNTHVLPIVVWFFVNFAIFYYVVVVKGVLNQYSFILVIQTAYVLISWILIVFSLKDMYPFCVINLCILNNSCAKIMNWLGLIFLFPGSVTTTTPRPLAHLGSFMCCKGQTTKLPGGASCDWAKVRFTHRKRLKYTI